ncbi:bromodomain and PHD finger-containing protein 3 [Lentinula raphanica]|uniref:Bromodomain and PHD finger-containing protein 3 n=1 Tax=Lentinula raphanica TaxID=153919 RepID=A0AA38UBD5_9AGAR|nr:bromodomain and PHD finger-containing protein 3 [Lentinula raphanica]
MARGVRASSSSAAPAVPELPKVSFQKIDDELTSPSTGVDDRQARSYGYNDFSDFERPEHYIRHIEPLEAELARQVEYDMDEQDKEWLDNLNVERRKEQMDKISYETFEIIMDRLEKEWFDLTKNIPKADFAMPSEDSTCAICDDSEGENSNAIVFCDGCNLAVHQDCYGVPYIPEGQWLCRKCTVSPENPVSCILCPNEGGAFKQTVNGEWVHLLCAIWVPETRVANDVFMEPVIGVDKISKQRWKLKCSICDVREGACIQCAKTSCFLAFHTTCARNEKLLLPMKSTQAENATLTCYCDKHLPKEQQEAREAALAVEAEEEDHDNPSKESKSARAYAKTYKPGPPLVPAIIVDRITQYISKVNLRKRGDFLLLVCKYWSLKREARRGAPLLKRLHLEPWTAAAAAVGNGKLKSEEERGLKLEQLRRLEQDLEQLRELSTLTWKREQRKLQQMNIVQGVLTQALYPHEPRLRLAFERIVGYDKNDFFKNPVSKTDVPDYFDVITRPMHWSLIDAKLDRHEYWAITDFKDDIELVLNNAMTYNKAGTPFFKAAQRIHNSARPILEELERAYTKPNPNQSLERSEDAAMEVDTPILPSPSLIGDLEPPLELVELLLSLEAIKDESSLVLTSDPISSLINVELPVFKPPPPPLPKPRKASKAPKPKPPKPDRSEEYKRSKAKKAEERARRTELEASMAAAAEGSPLNANLTSAFIPATLNQSRSRPLMETPSVPEFRDHVDNQASFKLFNSGWILPSDQKRRTRVPTAPPSSPQSLPSLQPGAGPAPLLLQPPKKKIRLDRGTSKLSVFSTAEEENQTLNPDFSRAQLPGDTVAETVASTSIVNAPATAPILEPSGLPRIGDVIRTANGKVIIEELDSPATRREKHMRRKAEKGKLKYTSIRETLASTAVGSDPSAGASSTASEPNDPTSSPPSLVIDMGLQSPLKNEAEGRYSPKKLKGKEPERNDIESELSSLSEVGEDDPAKSVLTTDAHTASSSTNILSTSEESAQAAPVEAKRASKISEFQPDQQLEAETLVWAKADTFPWWPATVHDIDDPRVPPAAKKMYANMKKKNKDLMLHFVRFYDKQHSWQCLTIDKLLPLGEDDELDADLVANQSKRQKWKNAKLKAECREAFR